jgi:glutamate-5-semialdehyde dehydrogenase
MDAQKIACIAREASAVIATAKTKQKDSVLDIMADKLASRKQDILSANKADVEEAKLNGIAGHLINRLHFYEEKINSRIRCLHKIKALRDPVGQFYRKELRPNGLEVARVRVPLGVILMIYESRPHVTINAGAFCLKSGNAVILRGGSEAKRCNALLGKLWQESLKEANLPPEAIQVVSASHEEVDKLLQLDDYIDLVIPRGGRNLIKTVKDKSRIPVIKHFAGVCHVYLDKGSDIARGINIALDSKCLMPEVCNAMETLLVSQEVLSELPKIISAFRKCGVTVKGCEKIKATVPDVESATEKDWETEYLDMVVSIRVVKNVEEAIEHINRYGSHHTDSIVTNNKRRAGEFARRVDSAVVLVNASTMFCDGESLGMGAEIGISTDKLHARGPMGLEELTSYKFVIVGDGHTMGKPKFFRKSSTN